MNIGINEEGNGSTEELVICPDCGEEGTQYWDYIEFERYDDGFVCDNDNCPDPPKDK